MPGLEVVVHEATLVLQEGADPGGPGAAVTVRLCGRWDHEPPCAVPHRTLVTDDPDHPGRSRVRVVLVCPVEDVEDVRAAVEDALREGGHGLPPGPRGQVSSWRLVAQGPSALRAGEGGLADRLRG